MPAGILQMMVRVLRVGVVLLCAAVVVTMMLWSVQRRLIYFPAGPPPPVEDVLPGGQSVAFQTADGVRLEAWWFDGGPTSAIVLPGNAGNRAARAPLAAMLHDLGLSVLLVDYRGYGGNPGSPHEEGLIEDGLAAVQWVEDRRPVTDVVLFGESVGAAVAVGVAVRHEPSALILRSPFTSLVDVARTHYGPVPERLLRDRFPTIERITDIRAPMLVIAGEDDEIVPWAQSHRLAEAANARLVTVPGARHNDRTLLDGEMLRDAVDRFLRQHALLSGPDS